MLGRAKGTRQRAARRTQVSAGLADSQLIEDLVAANRTLADHGVLDGYAHVSARHNCDPHRYLLSCSLAPALVTADDIEEGRKADLGDYQRAWELWKRKAMAK